MIRLLAAVTTKTKKQNKHKLFTVLIEGMRVIVLMLILVSGGVFGQLSEAQKIEIDSLKQVIINAEHNWPFYVIANGSYVEISKPRQSFSIIVNSCLLLVFLDEYDYKTFKSREVSSIISILPYVASVVVTYSLLLSNEIDKF